MWIDNLVFFEKNWSNHPPIFYISDENDPNVVWDGKVLSFPGNYAFRLKEALKQIDSDYVFLTLDDYFPNKPVNFALIDDLITVMSENDVDYMNVYPNHVGKPFSKKMKILTLTLDRRDYEVSLTPGIWKRTSLLALIGKDESPWEWEVMLTKRCHLSNYRCMCCYDKTAFPYLDVVRKGKYLKKAYLYLVSHNMFVSDRKIKPQIEVVFLSLRSFIAKILPVKLKKLLKKLSGKTYYSDYSSDL